MFFKIGEKSLSHLEFDFFRRGRIMSNASRSHYVRAYTCNIIALKSALRTDTVQIFFARAFGTREPLAFFWSASVFSMCRTEEFLKLERAINMFRELWPYAFGRYT